MSTPLSQRADMDILRISLGASESPDVGGGQSEVVFELMRRGEVELRTSVPADKLGLGGRSEYTARRFSYAEPDFRLPESLAFKLADSMRSDQRYPLWVELDPPGSRLSFVPWEDLIGALPTHVPPPVLRLPRHSPFRDNSAQRASDVVLCASEPMAKAPIPVYWIVGWMADAVLAGSLGPTTVHIFTDQRNYTQLAGELHDRGLPEAGPEGGHGVRLYDPAEAKYDPAEFSRAVEEDDERLDSPWLNWMADSLPGGRAIGVVHFLCHGYFSAEQGALAFAESPSRNSDANWARFVGARQLNTFLDRIGASAVAFASPSRNYSVLGLRLLVSQLASLRPGPTFMHGVSDDVRSRRVPGVRSPLPPEFALNAFNFYRLLSPPAGHFFPPSFRDPWPRLGASCLYCPPELIYGNVQGEQGEAAREAAEQLPETTNVIHALGRLAGGGGEGSGWMTSGSNIIKRAALDLIGGESTSERQAATHAGAKRALEFVSDVLRRHAGLGGDDDNIHTWEGG